MERRELVMVIDQQRVTDIIRETAELDVLPRFQKLTDHDIMEKAPGDIVTVADYEAEARLSKALSEVAPGADILAEEAASRDGLDLDKGVLLEAKTKVKKPSMYNVLLLNDDYTPMEFVVLVLESVFNKKQEEATQIMLHVHKNGIGVCGTFTYEVAESKCKTVIDLAKKNEHPLQCTMEKN